MSDAQILEAGAQVAAKQARDLIPNHPVDLHIMIDPGDPGPEEGSAAMEDEQSELPSIAAA